MVGKSYFDQQKSSPLIHLPEPQESLPKEQQPLLPLQEEPLSSLRYSGNDPLHGRKGPSLWHRLNASGIPVPKYTILRLHLRPVFPMHLPVSSRKYFDTWLRRWHRYPSTVPACRSFHPARHTARPAHSPVSG